MVKEKYVPQKGDLIWINFTPQSGHEQAGKRPAIVLSPEEYNKKTSLMIVCPITSKIKGYPFEVKLDGQNINGVILADQVKNLDWKARNSSFIEKANSNTLLEVQEKLFTLLG